MCIRDRANAIVKRDRKLNRHYRKFFTEAMAELSSQEVVEPVSYTHLRAHETVLDLVCRLLLEKKKKQNTLNIDYTHIIHINL